METAIDTVRQIVLVEDNPADVMLVQLSLRDAGLNCALTVVDDGDKAILLVEQLDQDSKAPRIDLLLLDLHLPKRDGADILNRLRSTEHNAQTPVIVMTASDAPSDYQTAQKHAAIRYFRKPTSLAEFMQLGVIVRDVLDRKKPARNEGFKPQAQRGAA